MSVEKVSQAQIDAAIVAEYRCLRTLFRQEPRKEDPLDHLHSIEQQSRSHDMGCSDDDSAMNAGVYLIQDTSSSILTEGAEAFRWRNIVPAASGSL